MTFRSRLDTLHRTSWRWAAGALLGTALLAGCGGGTEASGTDTASAAVSTGSDAKASSGRTAQALAASYSWCAGEGGTCSFSGTREVRFGADSRWTTKVATGSISCSTGTFGDPAYGTPKSCQVSSETTSGSSSSSSSSSSSGSWTWCAGEGSRCSFSGTATVRYGTASQNVTKTFTGGTVCSNSVFGDPAPGTAKACWYGSGGSSSSSGGSSPTPAPAASGKTQILPLGNQWVGAEQGQYTTIQLRFYAVPMGANTKAFVHLYNSSGGLVAETGHHMRYIQSANWSGNVRVDHPVYVPQWVPPGSYRISVGLYYYTSPYYLMMDKLQGNGVSMLYTSSNNSGYNVGTMQVSQTYRAATADVNWGQFLPLPNYGF